MEGYFVNWVRLRRLQPNSSLGDRKTLLWEVQGTPNAPASAVEDVGVDHRRADVPVAEKFLDGPDVVPFFEEMGSERMPERVAGDSLDESGKGGGLFHGSLENRFVEVVTIQASGTGVLELPCCGKYPLPAPLLLGSWKFPIQSIREFNVTSAPRQILFVLSLDLIEVSYQPLFDGGRQNGHAVFASLSLSHDNLPIPEIDVLYS